MRFNQLVSCAAVFAAAYVALTPVNAHAQRRAKRPALSEETLVPADFLSDPEGRRFGYPDGVEIGYFSEPGVHHWVLADRPFSASNPTPTPTPIPTEDGAPAPAATPTPLADEHLEATPDEGEYLREVGLLRPTFVTLRFMESAQVAQAMVDEAMLARADETLRPHENLVTFKLEKYPAVSRTATIYNREFNLGEKTGGWRRGSSVLVAEGSIVLEVDARRGLRDGEFDSKFETLEKRARDLARYLLGRL